MQIALEYLIDPCPKPRMTRSDKWKKRPEVLRYFAFCDEVRLRKISIPSFGAHVVFIIEMSPSWSQKKQREFDGKPHQNKPDLDNMLKGLLDAVYDEDCTVWQISCEKRWGKVGKIVIKSEVYNVVSLDSSAVVSADNSDKRDKVYTICSANIRNG